MKQNLLIIPGFGESTDEFSYQVLAKKFKKDFNVVTYTPTWEYRTANNWICDLKGILSLIDVRNTTVVSFSLGAYITLTASETYPFHKIILRSLSPFLKEQLSHKWDGADLSVDNQDLDLHHRPLVNYCNEVAFCGKRQ